MSGQESGRQQFVQFYSTSSYQCSYLDNQRARSQVAITNEAVDRETYSQLIRHGFRRSGMFVYRPHCDLCRACVPVRLVANGFSPNRTQRKIWNRQSDMQVNIIRPVEKAEHYHLYQRYQKSRHAGGGMDEDGYDQYRSFLLKSPVDTWLVEFRKNGVLKIVSVIDMLDDGLSAVYTFFEPDEPEASYGVYTIMWQVQYLQQIGKPYVYLGYWIENCRKMNYKSAYQPLEKLQDGVWHAWPKAEGTAPQPE
ncbi:arginyltransferase [Leeia sp. TBRC 13508]|uniref:Aspartate/glutamate leucyltransferase n=1 Tax=Leeia speluncae TaxID=2884804 RepID=A0ABS8D8I7_9NEIS|nr:arginyltransferase [Leeia speluncae]MCB6184509.1 arginyltransferase [Leeia speluncae]